MVSDQKTRCPCPPLKCENESHTGIIKTNWIGWTNFILSMSHAARRSKSILWYSLILNKNTEVILPEESKILLACFDTA